MPSISPTPLALAIALSTAPSAWAESHLELTPSIVSASALGSQQQHMTTPAQVLDQHSLLMQRQATLGATLEGLNGVRSSSFGAGVGRPQIRGLDGPRVKVLSDGVDVLDASTISPDHAVTVEPLLAERIEVLKGPATLLYGGGALGGVVNVIDQKVPTYVPEKGYEGTAHLQANSVANEGAGAFGITAGHGNFAIRAEGSKLQADDYSIPDAEKRQAGAYNNTQSYTLGGSFIGERGYVGIAYGEQNLRYGLLAHEHSDCHTHSAGDWHCGGHGHNHGGHSGHGHGHDHDHDHDHDEESTPYVSLRKKRWDLRGELDQPLAGFDLARLRVGNTRYSHDEIEGGELGTRFKNNATDARIELTHTPLFGWHGVLGAQTLQRDFTASGEEAYVPPTVTRNHGVFLLEEYVLDNWRYELGLRHEWQSINASGANSTTHRGTSASAGAVWTFTPQYSLGLSLSRSQRLPSAEELYANGPHAASATVELGNPTLDPETSNNLELTLRKFAGRNTFSASVFRNQVSNFIYAADTGRDIGGDMREIQYRQEDAVFTGAELQWRFQATDATALTFSADSVRGRLRSSGNLPRIPAERVGIRLDQRLTEYLDSHLQVTRVQRQTDLAEFETQTAGYNLLSAGLSYTNWLQDNEYQLYVRGDNLLNSKSREHISFIKDDVLLPGRNLTLGLRVSF